MTESNELTRPIIGIENRSAQEVFDIMCDRISAASKVRAIREGDGEWVMVPREPTPEMIAAGSEARPYIEEGERDEHTDLNTEGTYAAMIAASPIPATGGEKE